MSIKRNKKRVVRLYRLSASTGIVKGVRHELFNVQR